MFRFLKSILIFSQNGFFLANFASEAFSSDYRCRNWNCHHCTVASSTNRIGFPSRSRLPLLSVRIWGINVNFGNNSAAEEGGELELSGEQRKELLDSEIEASDLHALGSISGSKIDDSSCDDAEFQKTFPKHPTITHYRCWTTPTGFAGLIILPAGVRVWTSYGVWVFSDNS